MAKARLGSCRMPSNCFQSRLAFLDSRIVPLCTVNVRAGKAPAWWCAFWGGERFQRNPRRLAPPQQVVVTATAMAAWLRVVAGASGSPSHPIPSYPRPSPPTPVVLGSHHTPWTGTKPRDLSRARRPGLLGSWDCPAGGGGEEGRCSRRVPQRGISLRPACTSRVLRSPPLFPQGTCPYLTLSHAVPCLFPPSSATTPAGGCD